MKKFRCKHIQNGIYQGKIQSKIIQHPHQHKPQTIPLNQNHTLQPNQQIITLIQAPNILKQTSSTLFIEFIHKIRSSLQQDLVNDNHLIDVQDLYNNEQFRKIIGIKKDVNIMKKNTNGKNNIPDSINRNNSNLQIKNQIDNENMIICQNQNCINLVIEINHLNFHGQQNIFAKSQNNTNYLTTFNILQYQNQQQEKKQLKTFNLLQYQL